MGCTPTEVAGRRLAAVRHPPIRLLPLGGSCRRKATEGAWSRGGLPVRFGCRPDKCLPSPTPCNYPYHQALRASFLPRWGKKPLAWLSALGTANQRLLPLEGAVAVRRLRVLGAGAVHRFGSAAAPTNVYRPQRLAITPTISQATPASFLPRWGKKPFCWLFSLGTANQRLPCAKGDGGKRVPSGHNAEGVSDPQCRAEASTDHG